VATYEQVKVDHRPHNCEWSTAPLGDKNCHYVPHVRSVRTSVTDKSVSLVSYDDGKTSQVNTFNETPGVYVSWEKIEDSKLSREGISEQPVRTPLPVVGHAPPPRGREQNVLLLTEGRVSDVADALRNRFK
jgi:hypothetical protein